MKQEELYIQILSLKATKGYADKALCAIELMRTTGYVNIIDMLLLPLYYAWEKMGFGTLEEVRFESYLKKAYILFCHASVDYTRQMVTLLRKASIIKGLSLDCRSIIISLIRLYSEFT